MRSQPNRNQWLIAAIAKQVEKKSNHRMLHNPCNSCGGSITHRNEEYVKLRIAVAGWRVMAETQTGIPCEVDGGFST